MNTYKNDDALMHYGVLGMKWGIRRGKTQQAFEKASKKLEKYDRKVTKYNAEAEKKIAKAAMSRHPNSNKAIKRKQEIRRLHYKMLANMRKGQTWYKKMEKVFKNTTMELTDEQREIGQRYMNAVKKKNEMAMYDYMGR